MTEEINEKNDNRTVELESNPVEQIVDSESMILETQKTSLGCFEKRI